MARTSRGRTTIGYAAGGFPRLLTRSGHGGLIETPDAVPCRLAGTSMGAFIATELAVRQLAGHGGREHVGAGAHVQDDRRCPGAECPIGSAQARNDRGGIRFPGWQPLFPGWALAAHWNG